MRHTSERALMVAIKLATVELKICSLIAALERRSQFGKDRPPIEPGTNNDKAKRPSVMCPGFPAGCQNGGTFGSAGAIKIEGQLYCWDCAVKFLGIEGLPYEEQIETIQRFDKLYWKRLIDLIGQKSGAQRGEGRRRDLRGHGRWRSKDSAGLPGR